CAIASVSTSIFPLFLRQHREHMGPEALQPRCSLLWICKVKSTRSSQRVHQKLVNGFWRLFQQGLTLLYESMDSLRVCTLGVIIPYLLITREVFPDRLIIAASQEIPGCR